MRIPPLARFEGEGGLRWRQIPDELPPVALPPITPEERRAGPRPFVSVPRDYYVNDPEWREAQAEIWADFDQPTYVNGMMGEFGWNGRVTADGQYPEW